MTRAGSLAILLGLLLLAGCGGGTAHGPAPKPMSRAAFVRAANHACAVENRTNRIVTKKKPTSFSEVLQKFERETTSFETVIVAFRRLTPPRADQARFNRLLRTLDTTDVTLHRFIDAAQAGHKTGVKVLLKQIKKETKQLNARAAGLGLRVCAKK